MNKYETNIIFNVIVCVVYFKTVDKFWIGGNKHGCITDYFYP